MNIRFEEFLGQDAQQHVETLAQLRMNVFREFPYLYDGDFEYEKKYLKTYFSSPKSFVAISFDEGKAIGACTAILLSEEQQEFQKPFLSKDMDPSKICYFGESVLLPEYRGRGIGNSFMSMRISFAKNLPNVNLAAFCAVIRDENHPHKPKNFRPLDEFWRKRGFEKMPEFTTEYSWKDLGEKEESLKKMQFWSKRI